MTKRRKPSVYRKIRGIRDDEIRQAFQQQQAQILALAKRVFPEQFAAGEVPAVVAMEEAPLSCTFCYGLGHFANTSRPDGSVYEEPCKSCQPDMTPPMLDERISMDAQPTFVTLAVEVRDSETLDDGA